MPVFESSSTPCQASLTAAVACLGVLPPCPGESDFSIDLTAGPSLSRRATEGPEPGPLIERFSCLFDNLYCPKTNPNGIISLGIAENLLCAEEMLAFARKAICDNLTSMDLTYGDNLWGSRRLNSALAGFFNEYFAPSQPVLPKHIITGVGISALLDHLFHTILDKGDGVLLLKPYYAGFDRDLVGGRSNVNLIGVGYPGAGEEWEGPDGLEQAFEEAYRRAIAKGTNVRGMLICNPHNPLGTPVSRKTLLGYCRFAQKYDLHLVSDEIYAMSVYDSQMSNPLSFTSALSLDVEKELGESFDKGRLHVVYGMSKDFCANGFRIGALITQNNPRLLRILAQWSIQIKISSPADVIFSTLLTDPYLPKFLALNRSRLGKAQAFVRDWFEHRGVFVRPCNAGHFIWVDLASRLEIKTETEEKRIFQRLLDQGVYIAPGSAYHHSTPGWFRITFSVAEQNLKQGLKRMERVLQLYPMNE